MMGNSGLARARGSLGGWSKPADNGVKPDVCIVEVNLEPSGRGGDVCTAVLAAPSLDEGETNGGVVDEAHGGSKAGWHSGLEKGSKGTAAEEAHRQASPQFDDGQRVEASGAVEGARLDKDAVLEKVVQVDVAAEEVEMHTGTQIASHAQ